jgi:hypothetical protein
VGKNTMSISTGNSIVRDSLEVYYDMYNSSKSWKGKPTTNLSNNVVSGMQGITYTYVGMSGKWKKYSISGTWNAGTYPYSAYIAPTSFTGGSYYTTSAIFKTNAGHKFAGNFAYINYVNEAMVAGGTTSSVVLPDGSRRTERKNFAYTSTTSQNGYLDSRPLANGTSFDSTRDFLYVKEQQIELNSFSTPYIVGTRTTTQAFADISGNNNEITHSNLTYNSDNTFEFDGTNDLLTVATTTANTIQTWNESYSFEIWHKVPTGATWYSSGSGLGLVARGSYTGCYGLGRTTSGGNKFTHIVRTDASLVSSATPSLSFDTWYHVVGVYNAEEAKNKIYLNGVLQTNNTVTKSGVPDSGGLKIGGNHAFGGNNGGYAEGYIPIFRQYTKALTADEVLQNFEAERGRFGV